jgi:hypothetical protein
VLECSDADKSRARDIILKRFRDNPQRKIEDERSKIIAQYSNAQGRAAVELGPVEYDATIMDGCVAAAVRARYEWRIFVNGKPMTPLRKEKKFTCMNLGGFWNCF